jgi:hypothetical protein
MHRPSAVAETQHQTTMAAKVVGIILNQLTLRNDNIDFVGTDHA